MHSGTQQKEDAVRELRRLTNQILKGVPAALFKDRPANGLFVLISVKETVTYMQLLFGFCRSVTTALF